MSGYFKHPKRVQAEIALVSQRFGTVKVGGNQIVVRKFDLPAGLNKRFSRLLCVLPENYPEMPIQDMYLDKGLKRGRNKLGHYYEDGYGDKKIRKQGWAWYSIHFDRWKPNLRSMIRGDNLLTAIGALYDALRTDD